MTEPFNLTATATRFLGTIHATAYAVLPDACHSAEITDIYPGGNIQYVVDPGVAQLFVRFTRRDGPCADVLTPWMGSRDIHDPHHCELEVIGEFEGDRFSVRVPIYDFRLTEGAGIDPGFNPESTAEEFIVIALTARPGNLYVGCRIVPRDAVYPAIFSQVHGPASLRDCREWMLRNCGLAAPGDDA